LYYEVVSINTYCCKEITVRETREKARQVAQDKAEWGHSKISIHEIKN
jgi:hypothetical protein